MAKVLTLIAYNNKTGKIIFSTGIDEMYTPVQVILDRKEVSDETLAAMPDWMKRNWDRNPESGYFNIGEQEAKDVEGDFGDLSITIKTITIPDNFSEL